MADVTGQETVPSLGEPISWPERTEGEAVADDTTDRGRAVTSAALRAGFAVAARIASEYAEDREHGAGSAQEAAAAAHSQLKSYDWWQTATAPPILQAWEAACARGAGQPKAGRALETIRAGVMAHLEADARDPVPEREALQAGLAERARFEREAAALDLADAAQAMARADVAAREGRQDQAAVCREQGADLYARAGRRRRLADRIGPQRAMHGNGAAPQA